MPQVIGKGVFATVLLIIALALTGCSSSNPSSTFDPDAARHPANWADPAVHGPVAKAAPSAGGFASCQDCHAVDFSGGISLLACSTCHGVNAPHPAAWIGGHINTDTANAGVCAVCHTNGANSPIPPPTPAPAGTSPGCFNNTLCHGAFAAPASHANAAFGTPAVHGPDATGAPGPTTGFAFCAVCHGSDFATVLAGLSCVICHGVAAPHPAAWRTGNPFVHTDTDNGNATVCFVCHANGANSPIPPPTPPPAGTPPGCFNSTLCHGSFAAPASHANAAWGTPAVHGPDAKAAPGAATGFASCSVCHGSNFATVLAGLSCVICHGVSAPHPAAWMPGNTFVHIDTDDGNAPVCFLCHAAGANSPIPPPTPPPAGTPPGCFNSTLCHGPV